ncbi:hypothetical protein [Streptomyces capoamus]|uniref:hypothetical protein n=1 Tax=Streptomyces capoamus TaxID=68183 RepID=UPI0033938A19
MTDRRTASTITDTELDQLYDALDALRAVARGYCEVCGRGDAAPTVEDWETERQNAAFWFDQHQRARQSAADQRQRAKRAEAALARVRAACDQLHRAAVLADGQPHTDRERGIVHAVTRVRAALDQPAPTAATNHQEQ